MKPTLDVFEVLDHISDGFIALDEQRVITCFNRAAEQLLDCKREDVIGKKTDDIFPQARGSIFEEKYLWVKQHHIPVEFETYFEIAPYENWYTIRVYPQADGVAIYLRVITERKRLAQAIDEHKEQFHRTFEQGAVGINHAAEDGRFLRVNQRFCDMVGYTKDEILALKFQDITYPPDLDADMELCRRMFKGEFQSYSVEKRYVHKNGSLVWVNLTVSLMHDSSESPKYTVAVAEDISSRKQAESALKREHDLLTQITETSPVGICVINRDGLIIFANSEAEKILGLTRSDIIQRHYNAPEWRITDFEGYPLPDEALPVSRVMASKQPVYHVRHAIEWPDGQRVLLSVNAAPLFDERGQIESVLATIEDVTVEVVAENALRESEDRFRSIVEQSQDGIRLFNQAGQVIEWNRAAEKITGLKQADVLGLSGWDVLFRLVPEESRTPETYQELKTTIVEFLKTEELPGGKKGISERWIRCPDGTRKIVQTLNFPIKKTGSGLLCGIMRDITEDRLVKERQNTLTLEQEKVGILSNFIQDASHEFRTPLSVIYTGLGVIEYASGSNEQVREWTRRIKDQTAYIHNLVDAMLVLSRLDSSSELELAEHALNPIVQYVVTALGSQMQEKRVQLVTDLAGDLPQVYIHEAYLHLALKNLCQNAIQFTPRGGTITVRSRCESASVVIEVQDSGIGIDEEDLPFIFERFYRADKARTSRHAGLGLSIAQRIIALHRGVITVHTAPHQGSTFRVVLPAILPPVS